MFRNFWLSTTLFLAAMCLLGCNNFQQKKLSTSSEIIDVTNAFALAYREIDKQKKPFRHKDFKVAVRRDGATWTFFFEFLPETPGDNFFATVAADGKVNGAPLP